MDTSSAFFRPVTGAARAAGSALRLQRGDVLTLKGAAGMRVQVDAGRLWLTEPGDPDDHFIGAGAQHRVRHAGAVVIECDSAEPAEVRLLAAGTAEHRPAGVAARRDAAARPPAGAALLRR